MSHTKKDSLRSWIHLIVTVATTLPISGIFNSIGIFLDILLERYGETNSKAGWIGAVLMFSQGIGSLAGVYLFRYFGLRRVMFAAAILLSVSFVVTPHMRSLELIYLTYSIPFGLAFGIYLCVSVVVLPEFFDKYIGFAMSVRCTASACGTMLCSYLIPIIYDIAGWNTMISCFAGFGIMFVVFALSYHPLPTRDHEDSSGIMAIEQDPQLKMHLMKTTKTLLKDKKVWGMLTANVLFSLVEYTPNMFVIQYAKSLDYPLSTSKWTLVSFSSSSLISRFVTGFVSDSLIKFNKLRIVLSVVMVAFGIFSILCSFAKSFVLLTVYMAGIGVLDGLHWVFFPLVAMEINYRHADIMLNLMFFAASFGYLGGPPVFGWLYDVTGSFPQVLYAVSAGAVVAGFVVLASALSKSSKQELYTPMDRSAIETSSLKKCSLIVFEKETVL